MFHVHLQLFCCIHFYSFLIRSARQQHITFSPDFTIRSINDTNLFSKRWATTLQNTLLRMTLHQSRDHLDSQQLLTVWKINHSNKRWLRNRDSTCMIGFSSVETMIENVSRGWKDAAEHAPQNGFWLIILPQRERVISLEICFTENKHSPRIRFIWGFFQWKSTRVCVCLFFCLSLSPQRVVCPSVSLPLSLPPLEVTSLWIVWSFVF